MCMFCKGPRSWTGDGVYVEIGEPVSPAKKRVYQLKPFMIKKDGRYFYITDDGDYELMDCPCCGRGWGKEK